MTGSDPALVRAVAASVAAVLDLDPAGLRADTPLTGLGLDHLALVCAADLLAAELEPEGWFLDDAALAAVGTIGDLVATLVRRSPAPAASAPAEPPAAVTS